MTTGDLELSSTDHTDVALSDSGICSSGPIRFGTNACPPHFPPSDTRASVETLGGFEQQQQQRPELRQYPEYREVQRPDA